MTPPENDDVIVAKGEKAVLVYGRRCNGAMEAKEWLDSQEVSVQASFDHLFQHLVTKSSYFPNQDQFKKMKGIRGGSVWEFGRAGNRIFCVEPQSGNRWLLTNHYKKGGSKKDQTRAAEKAVIIATEHLERELGRDRGKQ